MSRKIGILGVQVGLTADKHDNLMRAINLIEEACENYNKIDLVCMPELFYSNPTKENRGFIGEHLDSEFFYEFSDCAKRSTRPASTNGAAARVACSLENER